MHSWLILKLKRIPVARVVLAAAVQATTAAQRDEAAGSLLTEMKTRSPLEGIENQCHRDLPNWTMRLAGSRIPAHPAPLHSTRAHFSKIETTSTPSSAMTMFSQHFHCYSLVYIVLMFRLLWDFDNGMICMLMTHCFAKKSHKNSVIAIRRGSWQNRTLCDLLRRFRKLQEPPKRSQLHDAKLDTRFLTMLLMRQTR